jgi:hypothetical protein
MTLDDLIASYRKMLASTEDFDDPSFENPSGRDVGRVMTFVTTVPRELRDEFIAYLEREDARLTREIERRDRALIMSGRGHLPELLAFLRREDKN